MARSASAGSVSVVVAATPSAARFSSAAVSVVSSTVTGLTITVTSYDAVATSRRRRLAVAASHEPRLASSRIFENACSHASSSLSAVKAIANVFTLTPAIAASARSFTFALVASSLMSPRRASRDSSASEVFAAASATRPSSEVGGAFGKHSSPYAVSSDPHVCSTHVAAVSAPA